MPDEMKRLKKLAADIAAETKVKDEDFHRFTGFLKESVKPKKQKKRRVKVKTIVEKPEKGAVQKCVDSICESLVCHLHLGNLTDDLSSIGLKFVLPVDDETREAVENLGRTYRHSVSSGVARFFDSAENKALLDDRISSLLPPTATKRFGCEMVRVMFDPIIEGDEDEGVYVEVFACPYLIGTK